MTSPARRTSSLVSPCLFVVGFFGILEGCSAILGFDKDVEEQGLTRPNGTAPDGGDPPDVAPSKTEASTPVTPEIRGEPDPSFGDGGLVTIPSSFAVAPEYVESADCFCGGALDENGGAFVACSVPYETVAAAVTNEPRTRLLRVDGTGRLDPTYGTADGGGVSVPVFAPYLSVQSDGRVVVAGYKRVTNDAASVRSTILLRFNADGTLDTVPGSAGNMIPTLNGTDHQATALAITGGSATVAGLAQQPDPQSQYGLWYEIPYWADLNLSTGNVDRVVYGDDPNLRYFLPSSIVHPSSAKRVLVGSTKKSDVNRQHEMLVGYVDGELDTSFGDGGTTSFRAATRYGLELRGSAALEEKTESIWAVTAGTGIVYSETPTHLAKYDSSGHLDVTYGDAGIRLVPPPAAEPTAVVQLNSLASTSNGKLLAAGYIRRPSGSKRALVLRLQANGDLDTTFAQGGYAEPVVGLGKNESIEALLLQPDGRFIAVGRALSDQGGWDMFALRFR